MDTSASKAAGTALRVLREQAKLTQAQVAQRLKKPQSFVSKTESGERALRAYEIFAYAQALELPARDLIDAMQAALGNSNGPRRR